MSRPPLPIPMVEGDTLPQLIVSCLDVTADGTRTPQNLAGMAYSIRVERPAPYAPLLRDGTVVDAAAGKVVFSWQPDDWKAGDAQRAFITYIDAGGQKRSFGEFLFDVARP